MWAGLTRPDGLKPVHISRGTAIVLILLPFPFVGPAS